jgi:hypothetical protein
LVYISEFISFHKSILICLGNRNRLMKTAEPYTLGLANLTCRYIFIIFVYKGELGVVQEYEVYWSEQVKNASGQRLEMLQRDLIGTKKLLDRVLLPVFGSFKDLILEHEMTSLGGAKIYADVYHARLKIVFEEDHFVTHAEKVTRDRFSFERARARSVAILGYTYFPYSRDELEKKPDFCQRNLYELIGRIGNLEGSRILELPVYEREVIRCAMLHYQAFRLNEVRSWLQLKNETCRKVIRELQAKGFVHSIGGGVTRCHAFMITDKAINLILHNK